MKNTDKVTYEEHVHAMLLEALTFFDDVCRKENIEYSLYGGSLIGAIRHRGFIPWDDDADVAMTRAEYDRFRKIVEKYTAGKFIFTAKGDRVPKINFADTGYFDGKKMGILSVDIFIIDNLPDDGFARKKFIFKLKLLQGMMKKGEIPWNNYNLKGKLLVFAAKSLGAGRSLERLTADYEEASQKYNGSETKEQLVSNDLYEVFERPFGNELFAAGYMDAPFEDKVFRIFKNYDPILRVQYGDYMVLPPEEERRFSHIKDGSTYQERKKVQR